MAACRRVGDRLHAFIAWGVWRWKLAWALVALLVVLAPEGSAPSSLDTQIRRKLAADRFDFATWEVAALFSKQLDVLLAPQRYIAESARESFVLDYLQLIADIQHLTREMDRVYADPGVADADAATAEMRTRMMALRSRASIRQPSAEAILEEQTATMLVESGFGGLGQVLPPVSSRFTPLPALLVVSPRDHIESVFQLSLRHGLDTTQREAIEGQVESLSDVSSLVVGIGGLAAYPAMLLESSSIGWIGEVVAHEWLHHYLTLRPLGWYYEAAPETRTINETTASIVGEEIGRRILARHYPAFFPLDPEPLLEGPRGQRPPPEPPEFDFRAEMYETRLRVDELLAEGRTEEAEAYMEGRRQVFVARGYQIRKINQAYFAFHGAYADEPGAAGADPIGPAVRELRENSPDVYAFINQISRITTLAQLESLLEEQRASGEAAGRW